MAKKSFKRNRVAICMCAAFTLPNIQFALAQPQQDSEPGTQDVLPVVEVVGMRASLATSQEIKKEKIEIVDSIVAEDIGKLPDQNITDALSRITGMQILRDRGEGAGVALRGLPQIETTLNGRETFTAGATRVLNFADLPAAMLAGIDVYKTSSANQIEGGVGGTVDLRTHRPFDFSGNKISGTARAVYGDLIKKTEPQYSVLASSRWKTEQYGEFGMLLDVALQKRAWREDQKSSGSPTARTVAGQNVIVPSGTSETTSAGRRERTSLDLAFQWRPAPGVELYTEGGYVRFDTIQDSYQINVSAPGTTPTSLTLFPGTNDAQSVSWISAPLSILSYARDTRDENKQLAVGGSWTEQAATIKADFSRTLSYNTLLFSGVTLSGTAANFSQNLAGGIPSTSVTGTNLLDPASFQVANLMYRAWTYQGSQNAARLDGEYILADGFLDTLYAGVRYAQRQAGNGANTIFGDTPFVGAAAGHVSSNPFGGYFPGSISIGDYLVGDLGLARDPYAFRNAFGVTTALPVAGNPLGVWHIDEKTQAAYLMSSIRALDARLDGNVGLRAVHTNEYVTGNRSDPVGGGILPIAISSAATDWLPSANARYLLGDGLYLRGALSKSIARQDFNQLSPSLSLNRNLVTPSLNSGSAGNPALKPIRSDNVDVAIERYFDSSTSISLTGFYKKVDGFVLLASNPETYDGVSYMVQRPLNMNTAYILGGEFGYQQFYAAVPDWLRGIGLQANYTYIDSRSPSSVLGADAPLPNLSPQSYNLIGMYEREFVSARLAYNWRSTFYSRLAGATPVYTKAYGWLDASFTYRLDKDIALLIEGTNLLRTVRSSYYGVETRPESAWINDRQYSVALTFSL